MRILFSVNHPSQYHMFRHLAKNLVAEGNKVIFFIQSRGIIEELVRFDKFEFRYSSSKSLRKLFKRKYGILIRGVISLIQQEIRILTYCLMHKVDFLMGTDIAISHTGYILKKPVFVFSDDDYVFIKPYCNMAYPFAKFIIAPEVTDVHKWKHKKLAYLGTQKSAYLHPKYFKPDVSVLEKYNLQGTKFFLIRLVNFDALHDALHNVSSGLNNTILDRLIPMLENYGKVLISFENERDDRYKQYSLNIDHIDIHSIIYYADMFIGDSQSMHIEAALLGTPSIRSNKWVMSKDRVNVIDYVEKKCPFNISIPLNDEDSLIKKVQFFLESDSKQKAQYYSKQFFEENTNLTDFMFWILSEYPNSCEEYKINPNIINKFH